MSNEKFQINFAPGQSVAEVTFREGAACKQLEPLPPLTLDITGAVGTVSEFLQKRVAAGQFDQLRSHITVNRNSVTITLVINEHDPYLKSCVTSKLQFNPLFLKFGINNPDKVWEPAALGLFLKMNRTFFPDRKENMELVSRLMSFKGTVNATIERDVKLNGSRTDNFAQVVNSNLPETFTISVPLFKGMAPETLEVETFAQIDGRDVNFVLMSPGAQAALEELRDTVINSELDAIRAVAPDIAIFEI